MTCPPGRVFYKGKLYKKNSLWDEAKRLHQVFLPKKFYQLVYMCEFLQEYLVHTLTNFLSTEMDITLQYCAVQFT